MRNIIQTLGTVIFILIEVFLNSIFLGLIFGVGLWPMLLLCTYLLEAGSVSYILSASICAVIIFLKSIPKTLQIKKNDTPQINTNGLTKPLDINKLKK